MYLSMRGFWRFAKMQGLSMTQMIALRQVYHRRKEGGCSISNISENLGVTNAAISQSLDKLVQMGLVMRTENPNDRRSKQISLTKRGEQILIESMRYQQAWQKELIETLTSGEADELAQALMLLAEKLPEIEHSDTGHFTP